MPLLWLNDASPGQRHGARNDRELLSSLDAWLCISRICNEIYALTVHVHKYSSVSFKLRGNLVLIDAGASLNALSLTG